MVGENGVPTFLFTDIEGSTLLWEKYPGEMVEALSRHNRLLESHFEQHRGTVFKTVGDEYCVVFKDPDDAVSAAESVQRALGGSDWPEHCPLRVRIAVHTGPATAIGSDFFGPTLNRVSRLMDTAHGGQCVVTAATASLLPPSRRSQLVDLGPHRLKDLLEPLHLYQVASSESFPPLRTLNAARTNLPYQPTTFVGRAKELVDVRSKLHRSRLVTLTGLGGSGKTRLALQAAAEEVEKQPEGVWLVELSSVQDPAAVPMAVASVVERSSETGTGAIVDALVDRRMLLVVDGCEHLIDEVAS
ncbi:MAG TPA: adenylate/guanylate cyclase domain-containing protein, partial [Fimbriimonas sp.]